MFAPAPWERSRSSPRPRPGLPGEGGGQQLRAPCIEERGDSAPRAVGTQGWGEVEVCGGRGGGAELPGVRIGGFRLAGSVPAAAEVLGVFLGSGAEDALRPAATRPVLAGLLARIRCFPLALPRGRSG